MKRRPSPPSRPLPKTTPGERIGKPPPTPMPSSGVRSCPQHRFESCNCDDQFVVPFVFLGLIALFILGIGVGWYLRGT